ncbi:MAG: hypothetical protein Q7R96_05935 [Nanoarchaeota archaeon]|nr:hypothetical protein [Nanoarchaeota archaeon]
MKKRAVIFILLALALLPTVQAIGLSPSTLTLLYQPGTQQPFTFYAMNNIGAPINAHFYIEGVYKQYITLKEEVVAIEPGQMREIQGMITFPEKPLEPGQQHIKIGVIEEPLNKGEVQGVIAKAGVEMRVRFDVPYPGKYTTLRLEIPPINAGEKLPITVYLKNLGKETINELTGTIHLETEGNIIKTLPFSYTNFLTGTEKTYSTTQPTNDFKPGDYQATVLIDYDGTKALATTDFKLGTLFVNLTNYTRIHQQGSISPITLDIQSRWNKNIDDIYAIISITDQGRELAHLQTPSISLIPWDQGVIRAYWDVTNTPPGDYTGIITLHYAGTQHDYPALFTVYKKLTIPTNYLLIGIIALIILIDILWLLFRKKRNN